MNACKPAESVKLTAEVRAKQNGVAPELSLLGFRVPGFSGLPAQFQTSKMALPLLLLPALVVLLLPLVRAPRGDRRRLARSPRRGAAWRRRLEQHLLWCCTSQPKPCADTPAPGSTQRLAPLAPNQALLLAFPLALALVSRPWDAAPRPGYYAQLSGTPLFVFRALTWFFWGLERLGELKPAAYRVPEMASAYVQSQVRPPFCLNDAC